jgi:hypothetical protein
LRLGLGKKCAQGQVIKKYNQRLKPRESDSIAHTVIMVHCLCPILTSDLLKLSHTVCDGVRAAPGCENPGFCA